jgi:hypothetical protein
VSVAGKTLTGEANVIRSFGKKSLENYTIVSAIFGVLVAAIMSLIPALSFGTFWQMAGIFLAADAAVYILIKVGVMRPPRATK